MKYLLIAVFACFAVAYFLHSLADDAVDDWIDDLYAVLLVGVGVALLVVYLARAFWIHQFW